MEQLMLETLALEKSFDTDFRLGPVSLAFAAGETLAFLGKNGSGKSTFFQLVTGNLDATKGEVRIAGKRLTPDTPQVKRSIGYLPQNHYLPRWVSGREILLYAASLYGIKDPKQKIAIAEAYWDCASYSNKPLAALSHGMQKRIALALATLHDPQILILDEPFSGLDLFHMKALNDEIQRRGHAGQTTLLSTHIAPYTAKLCSRVLIVEAGQVRSLEGWHELSYLARIEAIEDTFFPRQVGSRS